MGCSRRERSAPVRQCALTRDRRAADELIRFVLDPEGQVVPDLKAKLPGRGVWVTATRAAVEQAAAKRVFARAFAAPVPADPDLAGRVEALLEQAALERLSLAAKAGLVTTGFAKVGEACRRGQVAVLLQASDAAAGGRDKIAAKAGGQQRATIVDFTSDQLSLALGRSNVIHAALRDGGACDSFLRAVERLQRYCSDTEVRLRPLPPHDDGFVKRT